MAAKKTIAIIASTAQKASAIVDKFCLENYKLLLLEKEPKQLSGLSTEIRLKYPALEFEVVGCLKDGCWEADIIILDVSCGEQKEVAGLIKEVATQKPVINFSDHENVELENLLNYSKVITVVHSNDSMESSVCGKDREALIEISDILQNVKQSKSHKLKN